MSDLDRLKSLAVGGDIAAARDLLTQARRQGDLELCAIAAAHIDDLDVFADVGGALWDAGQVDLLTALARAWGLVLDAREIARLDALRDEAHGSRRIRLLDHGRILGALVDARHLRDRLGFRHAGSAVSSPTRPQTTICVAYLGADDIMTVGIAESGASDPSPGRGWRELQPWQRLEKARNLARLPAWANATHDNTLRLRTVACTAPIPDEPPPATALETLEGLLAEAPGDKAFKAVVKCLDKWPKADKAALPAALRRATIALDDWPMITRVTGRGWINRAIKGKLRPSDALFRLFEPKHITPKELTALAGAEALSTVKAAHLWPDYEHPFTNASLHAFANSPHVGCLERLSVYLPARGVEEPLVPGILLNGTGLTGLKTLWLQTDGYVDAMDGLDTAALPALEDLSLTLPIDSLVALLGGSGLPRLRRLALAFQMHGKSKEPRQDALAEILASAPALESVRWLQLGAIGDTGAAGLQRSTVLRNLEALALPEAGLTADGVGAICQAPFAPNLRSLLLDRNHVGDDGARALAQTRFERLQSFSHWGPFSHGNDVVPRIGPDGARALATAPWLTQLTSLTLSNNPLTDLGAEVLLSADLSNLQMLVLNNTEVGDQALGALAQNPTLTQLQHLILMHCPVGDLGFEALVTSPHLVALESIDCRQCEIGRGGAEALAVSGALPALRQVLLDSNKLTDAGVVALAASEPLERLDWLSLHQAGASKNGKAALIASPTLEGRFTGIPGFSSSGRERVFDQLRDDSLRDRWFNE